MVMNTVNPTGKSGYVPAEEHARLLEELARIREYADGLDNRLMAEQALRGRLVEESVASRISEVKEAARAELKADVLNEFSERELSLAARERTALEREGKLDARASELDARASEIDALTADLDGQRAHLSEERDEMIAQAQAFVLAERQAMDKEFEEKAEKVRRDAEVQLASFFLKACETIEA